MTYGYYDIHFKNFNENTVQLTLSPHESTANWAKCRLFTGQVKGERSSANKREEEENVIGTIMGIDINNAKLRLLKLLESQLG